MSIRSSEAARSALLGLLRNLALNVQQLKQQAVDEIEKSFPAGVGVAGHHLSRKLGQFRLTRVPRPAPHFAVSQQCKPTQVAKSARVPQIGDQIVECQLEGNRSFHVAVHHDTHNHRFRLASAEKK